MKCRHCQVHIVADAEGDWMHIPTMADRPCRTTVAIAEHFGIPLEAP